MAVRIPLKQYRLHLRDAYVEVDGPTTSIRVPAYFGSSIWTVPSAQVVAADLTSPLDETDRADGDDESLVFEHALNVPYLFTTGPLTEPTTALLFRTRQRVPVLTRMAALAPNVDVGFTRRETRSTAGALVDGILVRVADPRATIEQLGAAGIDQVPDPDRWLRSNRPLVTDPARRDARIALEERLMPLHRYLGWVTGVAVLAMALASARDHLTLAGVGAGVLAVSLLGQFLITRRLRRA